MAAPHPDSGEADKVLRASTVSRGSIARTFLSSPGQVSITLLLLKPLPHLVDLVVIQVFQLVDLPLLEDQFQVNPLVQALLEDFLNLDRRGGQGQETGGRSGGLAFSPLADRPFSSLSSLWGLLGSRGHLGK